MENITTNNLDYLKEENSKKSNKIKKINLGYEIYYINLEKCYERNKNFINHYENIRYTRWARC